MTPYIARREGAAVKAWIVGIATAILVVGSGVGLWMTWDSTQTSTASQPMGRPLELTSDDEPPRLSAGDPGQPGEPGQPRQGAVGDAYAPDPTEEGQDADCARGDEPATADPLTDWSTVVVDPGHRLPSDFAPPDLVDVAHAGFEENGDTVRELVIPDLAALRQAAEANGTPLLVVSAYRSYEYQERLFGDQVEEVGEDQALVDTAIPGHSEHQLGTTIDVLDLRSDELTEAFAETPAGAWVIEHAHEFGFVLSYPAETSDQTCYHFEPWHLRYVGRDRARQIHDSGLTPRQWMLTEARGVPNAPGAPTSTTAPGR
jgi:D-alanyl-D-alanine carboxypeptidase